MNFIKALTISLLFSGVSSLCAQSCGTAQLVAMPCTGPDYCSTIIKQVMAVNQFSQPRVGSTWTIVACSTYCSVGFWGQNGTCVAASLRSPEVQANLSRVAAKTKLLVASCNGGLVAFQSVQTLPFNPERAIEKKMLVLDKQRGE